MLNKYLQTGIGLAASLWLGLFASTPAEALTFSLVADIDTYQLDPSDPDFTPFPETTPIRATLTTEDSLSTVNGFTGYLVTGITGTQGVYPIVMLNPSGTTQKPPFAGLNDNLFNPNGLTTPGFNFLNAFFSQGGLAYTIDEGGTTDDYQLFYDQASRSYMGCLSPCVTASISQLSTFGSRVPSVTSVPGKEYSARPDINAQGTPDPEQTLLWDGSGNVGDGFDYGGNGEVDAMANNVDALFDEVTTNQAALLFSTVGDGRIFYEDIFGQSGIWATPQQINAANPPSDVDGLEVWGPIGVPVPDIIPDANRYSLADDVTAGGSVFAEGGGVIYTPAQIAAAIGRPDLAGVIDLDGLMVKEDTRLMFSIAAVDVFDGGEIWVWDGVGSANFLNHGGHLWDTAFDVQGTFGTASEDVNALEAIAVPEPLTLLGASAAIAFGAGFKRRKSGNS